MICKSLFDTHEQSYIYKCLSHKSLVMIDIVCFTCDVLAVPNKKKRGPDDFDTDGQWITCCCDRWIYEDCVDSEGIDNITRCFCSLF